MDHSHHKPLVAIGIAGGSGAGKTTLAVKLFHALGGETNVAYIVHDSYYKDLSHLSMEERAKCNFDHPESLETELLIRHIQALKKGNSVYIPTYDFATHCRTDKTVLVEPRRIILVEGILILANSDLAKEFDIKIYVDADADVRLARRISRDVRERGRTPDDVIHQYISTVRDMHYQYVEPSKEASNLIVNTMQSQTDVAIEVLTSHLRLKAGLIDES